MKQYVVDAFTEKIFSGNPAAVCVLDNFPSEEIMQSICNGNQVVCTFSIVVHECLISLYPIHKLCFA